MTARALPPVADRSVRKGTYMHVVLGVEGSLGWTPRASGGMERQRQLALEVSKLKRACAKNPTLLTIDNLELSLVWCWQQRLKVTSPVALVYHVEDALKEANQPKPEVDIITQRDEAISFEKHLDDEHSPHWLQRLNRARGVGLVDVLDIWRFTRGR